jgi:hypothetical protein
MMWFALMPDAVRRLALKGLGWAIIWWLLTFLAFGLTGQRDLGKAALIAAGVCVAINLLPLIRRRR